tara:strand:- start:258 stop:563 length:306 start_codon:yes stop_codon:yes gene_type:complete
MKIDRMKEGQLYEIKPQTIVEKGGTGNISGAPDYPVLKGWRKWDHNESRPPFIYLGYKYEDWVYNYQHTNKIHYVLWQGDMYVMDNQFAKHVVPVWEGEDG